MNPMHAQAENPVTPAISDDRRTGRRYEVTLKLKWRVSRRKRLAETGTGTTIDLSSNGVLFESDQQMPVDGSVELSISWPFLLHGTLPMQLLVTGRVARVSGQRVAIQFGQYEFRTARAANTSKS
jgi:PilZ domain